MKRLIGIFLILVSCQQIPHQSSKEDWLLKVGNSQVSTEEFVYAFEKNNFENDSINEESAIRDYLGLYTNFKLKVEEARALGLDTGIAYLNELEGYRKQLATPYLTETAVTNQLLEEAYHRMKEEVRASHILIISKEGMSPEDTLKNYQLIQDLRSRAEGGEDFGKLAREHSQDPSAKRNNGDLGYFTAFQMVYPFENAAYRTAKGSVSEIIKSQFGYHILKVTDRRNSRGQVKVSHIMIRAADALSKEDSTLAKNKIDEIYLQLKGGGSWRELCGEFSQDVNTRNTGGQLPWLSSGNVPPAFENTAFSMKDKGDISAPIKTSFGWHIIKLDDKKGIPSFESMEEELKVRVQRDSRAELSSIAFYEKIKKENDFSEDKDAVNYAFELLDSSLIRMDWKKPNEYENKILFSLKEIPYEIADLFSFIEDNQRSFREANVQFIAESYYDAFVEESLTGYEEDHLSEKYFDYRMLYQEYAEGIMLFQLMDQKIWSGALKDSAGIQLYYEQNKNDYISEQRYDAVVYNASTDSIRRQIEEMIENSDRLINSKKELKSYFNEKSALNLQTEEGLYNQSDPIIQELPEKSPGKYTFELNNRFYLLIVNKVVPASPLPLEEIRGQVISDYQEHLERAWVDELKNKYSVEINEKAFDNLLNGLETK